MGEKSKKFVEKIPKIWGKNPKNLGGKIKKNGEKFPKFWGEIPQNLGGKKSFQIWGENFKIDSKRFRNLEEISSKFGPKSPKIWDKKNPKI